MVDVSHRSWWYSRDLQRQSSIWSDVTAINRQPLPSNPLPFHPPPPPNITENSNAAASEAVLGLIEYQMNPKSYGIQYVSTACKVFLPTSVTYLCVSWNCAFLQEFSSYYSKFNTLDFENRCPIINAIWPLTHLPPHHPNFITFKIIKVFIRPLVQSCC